jgi:hypothetical protein
VKAWHFNEPDAAGGHTQKATFHFALEPPANGYDEGQPVTKVDVALDGNINVLSVATIDGDLVEVWNVLTIDLDLPLSSHTELVSAANLIRSISSITPWEAQRNSQPAMWRRLVNS